MQTTTLLPPETSPLTIKLCEHVPALCYIKASCPFNMYLMPTLIVPLQVRAFLLAAGFSLAFGAMFTKTYRVHQIFTRAHSGLVKSKVSNLGLQQFSQAKFYEML